MRIAITDNAGEVVDAIETFMRETRDLRPLWAELEQVWWASRRRVYETQGASTDTPWPLYDDTPEASRYVWAKGDMLKLSAPAANADVLLWGGTGRLYRAVLGLSSEGVARTSAKALAITIDVPYASHHDRGEGTAPPWAWPRNRPYRIPQRRLVAMGGEFRTSFAMTVSAWMRRSGARLGLTTNEVLAEINRTYAPEDRA